MGAVHGGGRDVWAGGGEPGGSASHAQTPQLPVIIPTAGWTGVRCTSWEQRCGLLHSFPGLTWRVGPPMIACIQVWEDGPAFGTYVKQYNEARPNNGGPGDYRWG